MRTTTLVLIVAGVVLLAVALWLATIMPIRSAATEWNVGSIESTKTLHMNLWGTPVRKSIVILNHLQGGTLRKVHLEGNVLGVNEHGPWTHSVRENNGAWIVDTRWYIDGKTVTEQEWNTYLHGR